MAIWDGDLPPLMLGQDPGTEANASGSAAEAILAEAQRKLAQATSPANRRIPDWAKGGVPFYWRQSDPDYYNVMFPLVFRMTNVTVGVYDRSTGRTKTLKILLKPRESQVDLRTLLVFPFREDGSYTLTMVRVALGYHPLPHISNGGACMSIGDLPPKLTGHDSYALFGRSLRRAISGIDLSSLYTSAREWDPTLLKMFPGPVRSLVRRGSQRYRNCYAKYPQYFEEVERGRDFTVSLAQRQQAARDAA